MAARLNLKTWENRIEAYRNSGLTAVNWCIKNNLKISTFKYWVTKLNKEKNKHEQEWIAVENPVNPVAVMPITIRIGSIFIEVPEKFNHETLRSVIKVLEVND
ncbi:MAG TPA: hypothetical protein VF941_14725 [Clostridia bacterium]